MHSVHCYMYIIDIMYITYVMNIMCRMDTLHNVHCMRNVHLTSVNCAGLLKQQESGRLKEI